MRASCAPPRSPAARAAAARAAAAARGAVSVERPTNDRPTALGACLACDDFDRAEQELRAVPGAELEPEWWRRLQDLAHADAAALLDDAAADGGRPPREAAARHEPEPVFWCAAAAAAALAASSSAAVAAADGCEVYAVCEPPEQNEPAHAALNTTAARWTSERDAHAGALAERADADAAAERSADARDMAAVAAAALHVARVACASEMVDIAAALAAADEREERERAVSAAACEPLSLSWLPVIF